jgi:SOS-response transcriptional repressor LexA
VDERSDRPRVNPTSREPSRIARPKPVPHRVAPSEAQLRSVYPWGSRGDPCDAERPPDPDHLEPAPVGRETLVGPDGFGVLVKGDSMAGRGILDGDIVWVNPARPIHPGKAIVALVGDAGLLVRTFLGEALASEPTAGSLPVLSDSFTPIGPVVGITSWRLPR